MFHQLQIEHENDVSELSAIITNKDNENKTISDQLKITK
jgi:hypothetical protein